MTLMLIVTACYTICSLSDKHAVSRLGMNGDELTFLMASATSVFMLFYLPFDSRLFVMSWQSFAAILLLALSKYLEFKLSALILLEMSAFELKAWLGLTLFASYATDLVRGISPFGTGTALKFGFIAVTAAGLFMVADPKDKTVDRKKVLVPLIGYLAARYGYGLTVTLTQEYISPTLALFFALVLLTFVLLRQAAPSRLVKEKPKGTLFVVLTKIPNVAGLVTENVITMRSMADAAFTQPMILAALFFIGIARKEQHSRRSLAGGLLCIAGVIGFQMI